MDNTIIGILGNGVASTCEGAENAFGIEGRSNIWEPMKSDSARLLYRAKLVLQTGLPDAKEERRGVCILNEAAASSAAIGVGFECSLDRGP